MDKKEICKSFNLGIYGSNELTQNTAPMILKTPHQFSKGILSLESAVNHVCNRFQVSLKDLTNSSKLKHIVDARSVLALLGRIGQQDWSLQDVGILLNKNSGTISRLVSRAKAEQDVNELLSTWRRIADRRPGPKFHYNFQKKTLKKSLDFLISIL